MVAAPGQLIAGAGATVVAAAPAVRHGRRLARGAGLALFVLPLLAALPLALAEALRPGAWAAFGADPQWPQALTLGLRSAFVGTALALVLTMLLTTTLHGTPAWRRLSAALAPMLALPHAAFAIGLAWLLAPAGLLARLLAPAFGWDSPPSWQTVNDPGGWLLTGVLVLKELPFLLWNTVALLARPEVAAGVQRQIAVARTLGYTPQAWWWRVGWAQWLPRLAWPLLAVLAYGLTVVDLALIVGPTSPPTLAMLAYADLQDGNVARNARGAVGALVLALALAALVLALWFGAMVLRRAWVRRAVDGRRAPVRQARWPQRLARAAGMLVAGVYLAVLLVLVALSVAGVWSFPALTPQLVSLDAWRSVAASASTVGFTAALAAAASAAALGLTMAWLEATPPHWDRRATPVVLAPLVLPGLLLMAGLYQGALHLRLDGSMAGLLWVHTLVVLPYSFITLQPAWRSFDARFEHTALALGRSRWVFWWRVKWPLLAAPLAAAAAVGFAVSVAQFLATQFLGAGRHATVTTEAVTLASGGQRTLAAAFALLQALLPLAGFALASRWRRPTMAAETARPEATRG